MGNEQPLKFAGDGPQMARLGVGVQTHILIVDDSSDDRNMYAHYLAQKGYRVSKAHDGKDGLEKALGLEPDVVLLDLWLPRISGWEVMQRMKADARTTRIPVLVITGHTAMQPRGCAGWLTKPCLLDELGGEVARILEARG